MPSTLTWLDHDGAARDRSMQILALFREKDSRDELGLGGIRDSFADALFPGTSTIQTRLRYMLFVPWICAELERKGIPSKDFGRMAREKELALINPLLQGDDTGGVFGRNAKGQLQRLPSSVYWAGLRSWGILRLHHSQADYHRWVDTLYARRKRMESWEAGDGEPDPTSISWHPALPAPPDGFPLAMDFRLTSEEAEFLLDCLCGAHPDSLLAWLAKNRMTSKVNFPWDHAAVTRFDLPARKLIEHGRRFSELMHGAAILYNLRLAEVAEREALVEEHGNSLQAWREGLAPEILLKWDAGELWHLVLDRGHTISAATREFVETWVKVVREVDDRLAANPAARRLVEDREKWLKRGKSRFLNRGTLAQWTGSAGLGRFNYRWSTVQIFLNDLMMGLEAR